MIEHPIDQNELAFRRLLQQITRAPAVVVDLDRWVQRNQDHIPGDARVRAAEVRQKQEQARERRKVKKSKPKPT